MSILLCTTKTGQPAVPTDKPPHALYGPLVTHLRRDLGEEEAAWFAEPVFDTLADHVDWYATIDGPVRAFNDLSEDEKIEFIGRIDARRNRLLEQANHYLNDDDPAKQALGRALRNACQIPAAPFRYLVGDVPVVAFWGYAQEAPDYAPLLEKYIAIHHPPPEPTPDPTPSPAPEPPISTQESPVPEADLPPVPPVTSGTSGVAPLDLLRFAGRILWGAVFLVLILLIGLWLYRTVTAGASLHEQAPTATGNGLAEKIRQAQGEQARLQKALADLRAQMDACDCQPDDPYFPKIRPESLPPPPPPETSNAPVEQVVTTCDITELAGGWQSHSNQLSNARTGKPVIVFYDFDRQGTGTTLIVEDNALKCRGKTTARLKNQTSDNQAGPECILQIDASAAYCDRGKQNYGPHSVECRLTEDGKANCTIRQRKSKPLQATFERRGQGE